MSLRVLLADDHPILLDGLASFLRGAEVDIVGEARDGEQALDLIERLRPEVAVLDIEMPKMTGIEVARRVRDLGLPTAIVILSLHLEPSFVDESIRAGVSGYVSKTAEGAVLRAALRAAAQGELYLDPSIARTALDSAAERGEATLTPRERDVLRILAQGRTSKEIAKALDLSTGTVDNHRRAIMEKLGIHHLAGLVKYAIRHGIATLD